MSVLRGYETTREISKILCLVGKWTSEIGAFFTPPKKLKSGTIQDVCFHNAAAIAIVVYRIRDYENARDVKKGIRFVCFFGGKRLFWFL